MPARIALASALPLVALAGCGTMNNMVEPFGGEQHVYGGTVGTMREVRRVAGAASGPTDAVATMILVVDVPLSLVGDTLTLPITVTAAGARAIDEAVAGYYFPEGVAGHDVTEDTGG